MSGGGQTHGRGGHSGNGANVTLHPQGHGGSGRGNEHRNTFYGGGKHHGSGNQSLSVPRTSIGSHMGGQGGNGHHRDASLHVNKRSGFSYF